MSIFLGLLFVFGGMVVGGFSGVHHDVWGILVGAAFVMAGLVILHERSRP